MQVRQADLDGAEIAWRTSTELLPTIVFTLDASGRLEYINARFAAEFGVATDEVVHEQLAVLVEPSKKPAFMRRLARSIAAKKTSRNRESPVRCEW